VNSLCDFSHKMGRGRTVATSQLLRSPAATLKVVKRRKDGL
jgi:hypothetical protein